ncbi:MULTISPECIES: heme ABC transporter ATP-binding protein [unclassified Streptomyces]|uniref:heme ABC transporter ATP-binding protein n=1 Tax=unclassified Streptomyces TaxID=2593676 RepID=UPI00081D8DCB|nr:MULTISPECIES: heme ABC transporter ATP-binding protein [unclassified Streptomyces]MYZ39884.1 heme ABC transporter ATP-binding protein [Streptomyces sp. SID4917]SCG05659.1 iron complex transport system ATP-binding protein [Streptomyces sp. MnatMP-M17]
MNLKALFSVRRRSLPAPAPTGTPLAEVRGLHVRLGRREVLAGVGLVARAGEVLALVGPNGAGKSTLLAALAADLPPGQGEVRIDGRPAYEWSAPELALRRAVLPQAAALAFPFPVEEVVRMGRAPWAGTPLEDEDGSAVAAAMAATEVTAFAGRPFSALSGGERARVALARVLAQRAPLLLLDEPTAALDLRHQELVLRICRERAAAGDAVVVVLHDLGLAAAHADRVAVLHNGEVAAEGPPAEVFRDGLLSRVYRQPVEVFPHPRTGVPLVIPKRDPPNRTGTDRERPLDQYMTRP